MQRLGLTQKELREYHRTLRTSHTRTVSVQVLRLDGTPVTNISHRILDGQVVVDLDAEVTRTLTLSLLDPNHALHFDSESPNDGALYADRMLRVTYTVLVPALNEHVDCVVFTGPIVKLDRSGDVVSVEAHGKERLALGELWRPLTIKKSTGKVAAIRTIMQATGEDRFSLPTLPARLPKTKSFDRMTPGWVHARRIAGSMNKQLFYTGRGVCTLRAWPARPVFDFTMGAQGVVLTPVSVSNSMDDFRNVVHVIGGKPKGSKTRVQHVATAPGVLHPQRLGRNGAGRYMVERIEDDNVRSKKEARRRAERVLNDRMVQVVEVTFDSLPIPHLDPGDVVRVHTDDGVVTFRLRRFSIPLGTDGDPVMSVGYLRKTYPNRRRIR